jgi:ribosome-binding factor A
MPLGGANATEIVNGLKRSAAFLRRLVTREVALRYSPSLIFKLDLSFDQADRIAALLTLTEVERDLRRNTARTVKGDNAG